MKTLSYQLGLHMRVQAPNFLKRFQHLYGGEIFAVYTKRYRNGEESITIWRTSDKCYRLLRTSYILRNSSDIVYKTFRSIEKLCAYLNLISP